MDNTNGEVTRTEIGNGIVRYNAYYTSGELYVESFLTNGGRKTIDNGKPSFSRYYINGNMQCCEYHDDIPDVLHRLGAKPAYITYDTYGKINTEEYRINGNLITKEDAVVFNRLEILKKISNDYK